MKRFALVVLAAGLVAAAAAPAGSARRPKPGCHVNGASVVARDSRAVLLSRDVQYDELTDGTELWGCILSRRRPFLAEATEEDQYGSSSFDTIDLHGTFAAVGSSNSVVDGTCGGSVDVVSLVRRRTKHEEDTGQGNVHDGCPAAQIVVVNSRGFAAWLQSRVHDTQALYEVDNHGSRLLDEGDGIDRGSLRFSGSTLHWTNAGVAHAILLH